MDGIATYQEEALNGDARQQEYARSARGERPRFRQAGLSSASTGETPIDEPYVGFVGVVGSGFIMVFRVSSLYNTQISSLLSTS